MPAYICGTCGVQYAPTVKPPARCPICEDERQYVGWNGQQWTTLAELRAEGRRNRLRRGARPGRIDTRPPVAIGQRALLVQTPHGNVMWDCITLVDDATIAAIRELGGLAAIAISHPHFYGSCVGPGARRSATARSTSTPPTPSGSASDPSVQLWEGETLEILPGLTLDQHRRPLRRLAGAPLGGGADGRGAILTGDTVTVVMDRRYVSFMYSYPNLIPLSAATVERIAAKIRRYRYQRVYGAFNGRTIRLDGAQAVERSAERYLRALRPR